MSLDLPPSSLFDPYYFHLHVGIVFVLGACFGSFFNVCIYRIPLGVSLSLPPSHCYQCGQPLKWSDNIPLLSYWIRGGRCRYCRVRFSIRYFLIELLTAALFTTLFMRYCNPAAGYSFVVFPGFIFISLLIIATFTDIDHWIIPDRVSLGGMGAGLALALIPPLGRAAHNPLAARIQGIPGPELLVPFINAALGAALGFGVLWFIGMVGSLIFRKEAMGRGDMKLMAMFGAFTGPLNTMLILILACLIGTVAGLAGMLLGKILGKSPQHPAIAALIPDATSCEQAIQTHDLTPSEALVVTRALTSPGAVGVIRHHLPFGPSLALAAAIVFLAWEPIRRVFFSWFLL